MKYLYPFECSREKLSDPSELQEAIEGNRREGKIIRKVLFTPFRAFSNCLKTHLQTQIHSLFIGSELVFLPGNSGTGNSRDFPGISESGIPGKKCRDPGNI